MADFKPKLSYTIPQASHATGIGRTKLYEFIKSGDLKIKKVGRKTIIIHDDLSNLLDNLPRRS